MGDGRILLRFWHWPVVALGPGRRLGLWLQGCSIHCEGCIAPESQPFDPATSVSLDALMRELSPIIDGPGGPPGVTISGGEPLDQPEALVDLLGRLRALGARDVLIYSGYAKGAALSRCPRLSELAAALVDGPFVQGDVTDAPWKGSEGQGLTLFRPELREAYARWSADRERRMQLVRKGEARYLIGIPRQGDRLREALLDGGGGR